MTPREYMEKAGLVYPTSSIGGMPISPYKFPSELVEQPWQVPVAFFVMERAEHPHKVLWQLLGKYTTAECLTTLKNEDLDLEFQDRRAQALRDMAWALCGLTAESQLVSHVPYCTFEADAVWRLVVHADHDYATPSTNYLTRLYAAWVKEHAAVDPLENRVHVARLNSLGPATQVAKELLRFAAEHGYGFMAHDRRLDEHLMAAFVASGHTGPGQSGLDDKSTRLFDRALSALLEYDLVAPIGTKGFAVTPHGINEWKHWFSPVFAPVMRDRS